MNVIKLVMWLLIIFLFSCATTQRVRPQKTAKNQNILRRQKYTQSHPNLSYSIKNAILNGKILIGMNKEQVRASWGNPNDIKKTVDISGSFETWLYLSPIRPLSPIEAIAFSPAQIAQYYQIANANRKKILLYFVNDKLVRYEEQ